MSATSDKMRREWLESDNARDAKLTTPENIVRYDDLSYGPDPKWNLLDVYRPKEAGSKKLPVIVIVHGGGWVYGTKETYQFYGMNLAQHGFAVVSYNYRLAPEHKYPSSFEDSAAVAQWIFDHADEYGLDTGNIFLAGDSAGGMMAGVISAIVTDPDYAVLYPTVHFPSGFMPNALLMNCGAYHLFNKDGSPDGESDLDLMHDFLDDEHYEEYKKRLNVVDLVNDKFPPAFIMTAQGDFMRRQAGLLVQEYQNRQIEFVYRMFGNEENPLFHVFHVTIYHPDAVRCNDEECAFLKEYIKA
jgi:acetyl esterase/lipase